jgi:uncharacterized protein (UPF0332 family)
VFNGGEESRQGEEGAARWFRITTVFMTTWRDIATENEEAAKDLLRARRYRSAVSRAYYAAYAMITGRLTTSGAVGAGDRNPSHKTLPLMVEGNLGGLSDWQRRDLKATTRRLYDMRPDADYRATTHVGKRTAVQSLSDLGRAVRLLKEAKS